MVLGQQHVCIVTHYDCYDSHWAGYTLYAPPPLCHKQDADCTGSDENYMSLSCAWADLETTTPNSCLYMALLSVDVGREIVLIASGACNTVLYNMMSHSGNSSCYHLDTNMTQPKSLITIYS